MGQPTSVTIRTVVKEDFSGWLPLWEGYNTFYERNIPMELSKETFRRFLDPIEPVHALIAESDGKLVGLVHYLFHRNTATFNDACYLQDLFTDESVRNVGIGKRLILAVYEKSQEKNSPRVYWQTHETNHVAQILYNKVAERSGFVVFKKTFESE